MSTQRPIAYVDQLMRLRQRMQDGPDLECKGTKILFRYDRKAQEELAKLGVELGMRWEGHEFKPLLDAKRMTDLDWNTAMIAADKIDRRERRVRCLRKVRPVLRDPRIIFVHPTPASREESLRVDQRNLATSPKSVVRALHPDEYAILRYLAKEPHKSHFHVSITVGAFRQHERARGTVSKRLKRLRKDGFVHEPNGTKGGVSITQQGLQELNHLRARR